jgi:hypothetical protein
MEEGNNGMMGETMNNDSPDILAFHSTRMAFFQHSNNPYLVAAMPHRF